MRWRLIIVCSLVVMLGCDSNAVRRVSRDIELVGSKPLNSTLTQVGKDVFIISPAALAEGDFRLAVVETYRGKGDTQETLATAYLFLAVKAGKIVRDTIVTGEPLDVLTGDLVGDLADDLQSGTTYAVHETDAGVVLVIKRDIHSERFETVVLVCRDGKRQSPVPELQE